ncbi:DUF4142 domain-containing protein [Bdellovibrio sp. HCB337]|uniref:DUF4142 domain-containing protein n=1 Tax=Bdellovibrio sp. HCB337 TaxID=3394358 RepID=UPI0039A5E77B
MKLTNNLFSSAIVLAIGLAVGAAQAADPAPPAAPLTDAQVLGLVGTANDAQINMGQVASTKGQNNDVKAFGAKMVVEHTAGNVKLKALEMKSKITREDSQASADLKKNTDAMTDSLKNAKDADFDKAFIDGQVKMHQDLLNALDQQLIPNAQNADVKAFLEELRTAVDTHLKEAQKIQTDLNTP